MNNKQFNNIDKVISLFKPIIIIISGLIFSFVCSLMFFKLIDATAKIIFIPFLIIGIAILIKGISLLFQKINMIKATKHIKDINFSKVEKLENKKKLIKITNTANKLYGFSFFIFWFVFLIVVDYLAIRDWNNNGSTIFFFSFIFWIAGIVFLIKNKKN